MHFQISNFKQIEKTVNPAKACTRKIYVDEENFMYTKLPS